MRLTLTPGPCPESVLALDVSSSATGWAIVRRDLSLGEFRLIRPPESWPSVRRIDAMIDRLTTGVDRPDDSGMPLDVVLEWSSGKIHGRLDARRVSGLAVLGQAQGSARQALLDMGRTVHLVAENEWTGSVPKTRRALKIAQLYPEYSAWSKADKDRDTADAIGLGVWFMQRAKLGEMVAQAGAKS